jgi:hypothetical protein
VGLFRRKSLAAELDGLNTRRDLLAKQLAVAQQRLDEALAARQVHLLEGNLDAPNGEPVIIERLRDERVATLDALNTLGQRITETENKLATERDLALRSAAGKELSTASDKLAAVSADLTGVVARIPAALAGVLARLPAPHAVSPERIQAFANGLVEALQGEVSEARAYATRLTEGDAALVPPRVDDDAKAPPAPIIERQTVFVLQPSRWLEPNGEVLTSGMHTVCDPPAETARTALANGTALDPLSDHAIDLRQRVPPRYGNYPPQDCVDLNAPKPEKLPAGSETITSPAIHSEFNRGRGGFATVQRNSR